jgi:hypothetical protein
MDSKDNVERDSNHDVTGPVDGGSGVVGHIDGGGCTGSGRGVTPIPSSIVQAICQIMITVDTVKKSQRNHHGSYNYASTDDIYAATTRKMGEVGLLVMSLEDRCEIKRIEKDGKISQWAHMQFSFVLATSTDTWTDPRARRTLYLQVTGAQTFQAAQSYAEKAYLRSLFKLPTGDMDPDSMPQADTEDAQVSLITGGKRKSSAEGKRDGSVKRFNEIRAAISSSVNPEMLRHIRETYAEEWATMAAGWAATLDDDYSVKMDELSARADA